LAISAPIREEFQMGGVSPARIVDLPNGYDPALFHPLPAGAPSMAERRIALGLPPEGLVFAYSGKLNRGKGLERLITIWGRFAAEHPTARLLLIGSGKGQYLSCEEELKKQAQAERVDASILFTGYVEDVAAYLHVADAFVFPSESEAQGLSVLEAMACGVPVLASDIPGIADMVRDGVTGRLVPPQAVEAWLAALQEFVEQRPRFAAMAESAVAHAEAAYAIAAIAGKHAELFCQLLSPSVVSPR
ncbi:MAG: glycosyltransferase, partial [Verrucomicrobiota bacterium]|nr:glycosyltransferase [Verrucomicrobiota bacterium]